MRIGETLTLRCDTHYFFPHIGSQMQSLRCETGGVWSETPQTACVGKLCRKFSDITITVRAIYSMCL